MLCVLHSIDKHKFPKDRIIATEQRYGPRLEHFNSSKYMSCGSNLTTKSECKQKVLSTHMLPQGGSHLIIFISNKPHLFIIPKKRVSCLYQLGCQLAHSIAPLAVKSRFSAFLWLSLAAAHAVQLPPHHHKNDLTSVDSSFRPLFTQTSLPAWLPWEPFYLSGLSPSGPSFLWSCPLSFYLPGFYDRFCLFDICILIIFCAIV